MQTDRLREQAMLPPLEVGDILVISHVGAYCHTQSMQFIQARPATVLLGPDGPEVIRRRETWRDVFALDHLPERLRGDGCRF
jgi:diaminopimelate decarboxylase